MGKVLRPVWLVCVFCINAALAEGPEGYETPPSHRGVNMGMGGGAAVGLAKNWNCPFLADDNLERTFADIKSSLDSYRILSGCGAGITIQRNLKATAINLGNVALGLASLIPPAKRRLLSASAEDQDFVRAPYRRDAVSLNSLKERIKVLANQFDKIPSAAILRPIVATCRKTAHIGGSIIGKAASVASLVPGARRVAAITKNDQPPLAPVISEAQAELDPNADLQTELYAKILLLNAKVASCITYDSLDKVCGPGEPKVLDASSEAGEAKRILEAIRADNKSIAEQLSVIRNSPSTNSEGNKVQVNNMCALLTSFVYANLSDTRDRSLWSACQSSPSEFRQLSDGGCTYFNWLKENNTKSFCQYPGNRPFIVPDETCQADWR